MIGCGSVSPRYVVDRVMSDTLCLLPGELFVNRLTLVDFGLRGLEQFLIAFGICLLDHAVPRFVARVLVETDLRRTRIEHQRRFARGDASWVVMEERPVTGVDGGLLLIEAK